MLKVVTSPRYVPFSFLHAARTAATLTISGPPELRQKPKEPPRGLTENLADTYLASGSACLDFFFHIVADTTATRVKDLATKAWKEDPLTTLKLIFQLRGVRGTGKSDKPHFYDAGCWLYDHHPRTLIANVGKVAPFGYFKDLLELVQRVVEGEEETEERMEAKMTGEWRHRKFWQPSKAKASELREEKRLQLARRVIDRLSSDEVFAEFYSGVAQVFAGELAKDLEAIKSGGKHPQLSLAAKWCPSLDSSYDKTTLLCEAIARLLFPRDSDPVLADPELLDEHYAYRVRDKLRKQVLVPLRKALQLPEIYMSDRKWDELPYNRVASVAMKTYTPLFMAHDKARFESYLSDVKAGKASIAAGALLPHEIVKRAVGYKSCDVETAELQWRAMVAELRRRGTLQDSLSICDVSGSMSGTPMEVAIALGLLTAELSEEPWRGRLVSFSANPAFHEIRGETLEEKYRFVERMPWGMNTDFQKVFDRILEHAKEHRVDKEKMVKRLFVFSDMEFDDAAGKVSWTFGSCPSPNWWGTEAETPAHTEWETDYMAIKRKFEEAGYGKPPEIVFWNLRDSQSVPVTKNQAGAALVSGFSKNMLKLFLEGDGVIDPVSILRKAISGEIFDDMVVVD